MNHPTSPRQHKKIQKALKGQGKSFPGNSKSEIFLPTKANNPLVKHTAISPNLNCMDTQEPEIPANLEAETQESQPQLKEGKSFLGNSKSEIFLPTIANNPMVKHTAFAPNLNCMDTQEPKIPANLEAQTQESQPQLKEGKSFLGNSKSEIFLPP